MHPCAVEGCGVRVRTHVLMCRPHWRQVSRPTQQRVYRTYSDWLAMPSLERMRAYREAVAQAVAEINAVAVQGRA